ncbi:hypothetical protein ACQP3C_28075, partial [Escherichia coli]
IAMFGSKIKFSLFYFCFLGNTKPKQQKKTDILMLSGYKNTFPRKDNLEQMLLPILIAEVAASE